MKKIQPLTILIRILIVGSFLNVYAQNVLPIAPIQQTKSLDCWAICCEMILLYYQACDQYTPCSEQDILNYGTNGADVGNYFSNSEIPEGSLAVHSMRDILTYWGTISSSETDGDLTFAQIQTQYNAQKPVIAHWT